MIGEWANDGPPPDLLGADARSHGLAGGNTTPTQDGMIAECQREPQRYATRYRHGAAATTLTRSLRRFVTGDPLPLLWTVSRRLIVDRIGQNITNQPGVTVECGVVHALSSHTVSKRTTSKMPK
jgi:hypothetical protein